MMGMSIKSYRLSNSYFNLSVPSKAMPAIIATVIGIMATTKANFQDSLALRMLIFFPITQFKDRMLRPSLDILMQSIVKHKSGWLFAIIFGMSLSFCWLGAA